MVLLLLHLVTPNLWEKRIKSTVFLTSKSVAHTLSPLFIQYELAIAKVTKKWEYFRNSLQEKY